MSSEVSVQSCLAWLFWACCKQNSMVGCSSGRQILTRKQRDCPLVVRKDRGERERGGRRGERGKEGKFGQSYLLSAVQGLLSLSWFCLENGEILLQTLIETGLMMLKMPPIN